ncbi:MAG: hypothetical protein ACFFF9_10275 [Candidatus Thorarchaeota archaeon]
MSKSLGDTLLSIIIALLLIGSITCPIVDAQGDDFPIGLHMHYNIAVYIDDPYDYPDYEYDITYDFTSWIDELNRVVEYSRNHDGDTTTLVQPLHDVHIDIPGNPPIWRNVAYWEIDDMYEFSGINYVVHHTGLTSTAEGSYEWFLLWNETQSGNLVIKTMLGYHSFLGILVDYDRETNSTDGSSPFEKSDLFLMDTNLHNYAPLLQTTTTTTIPTTTTTSTTYTTSPTSRTEPPSMDINVILSAGIVIECMIIVLFCVWKQSTDKG